MIGTYMDLRQLQTFVAAAETLNFTRTARKLGRTQANVTQQVQQLEKSLRTRLFERLGKGIALTDAGLLLLPRARHILAQVRDTASAIEKTAGALTIGAAESLCISRLPRILQAYRAAHPDVLLTITLLDCNAYLNSLDSNSVDIVFALGERLASKEHVAVATVKEPLAVCVSPNHELAAKKRIRYGDFAGQALLLTEEGCHYRGAFLDTLRAGSVLPRFAMEASSVHAIKQAAIYNLGVCALPHVAVADALDSGALVRLPYRGGRNNLVTQVLRRRDKWLSPALAGLLATLADTGL